MSDEDKDFKYTAGMDVADSIGLIILMALVLLMILS